MTTPTSCPKCQSTRLRWLTVKRQVPIDVLQCQACGVVALEEDWYAPLRPMVPGRCVNCGERRDFDQCSNCGLTRDEDVQVHDELRFMIDPELSLLDAARSAVRIGRSLIALKLATAAVVWDEDGHADIARALRVWLISRLADGPTALEDARAWVDTTADPPALAYATFGQQLQADYPGQASEAYEKALKKDRTLHNLRARRAQILYALHREGQAIEECCRVLEHANIDDQTALMALDVAEQLCDLFEGQMRNDEIQRMIDKAGIHVEKSARMLAHQARLQGLEGDLVGAKASLKKAKKINPELDIYERVERVMKPQNKSWWRW